VGLREIERIADFWIGESGIWFCSLMWEHGKNEDPVEFLDDRGLIKNNGGAGSGRSAARPAAEP